MAILDRESHRRAASDEIEMVDGSISRRDRIVLGGGWPGSFDQGGVRFRFEVSPAVHVRYRVGPAIQTVLGVSPK